MLTGTPQIEVAKTRSYYVPGTSGRWPWACSPYRPLSPIFREKRIHPQEFAGTPPYIYRRKMASESRPTFGSHRIIRRRQHDRTAFAILFVRLSGLGTAYLQPWLRSWLELRRDRHTSAATTKAVITRAVKNSPMARAETRAMGHREFHRHLSFDDVFEGFLEDGISTNDGCDNPNYADSRERFPHSEPHCGCRQRHKRDATEFQPLEAVFLFGMLNLVRGFRPWRTLGLNKLWGTCRGLCRRPAERSSNPPSAAECAHFK